MSVPTFTLTVQPTSKNLYLYPGSDIHAGLAKAGEASSYLCVDDVAGTFDTSTYVYTNTDESDYDLHGLTGHTTETGTINKVTFFNRGYSKYAMPDSSASYRIVVEVGSSGTYRTTINLTEAYALNYKVYTSQPSDSSTWTWGAIDVLRSGVHMESPAYELSFSYHYGVTGDGNATGCTPVGETNNWECVDEIGAGGKDQFSGWDDNTTHVHPNGGNKDYYTFTLASSESTINDQSGASLTIREVYVNVRMNNTAQAYGYLWDSVNGEHDPTNPWNPSGGAWVDRARVWLQRGDAGVGADWGWHFIDHDLEIGWSSQGITSKLTGIYLTVVADGLMSPEFRCTQSYAVVNYSPSASTFFLNMPTDYNYERSEDVKSVNFWSGDRTTYPVYNTGKSLSLTGIEFGSSAESNLDTVKDNMDYGTEITLSGFIDVNLNTTWYVKNFDWNINADAPNTYNWVMELEKA